MNASQIGAAAGIPQLNPADIPQNIRTGNSTAKQAYTEGLAFEDVLVNQLTQQLASTMSAGSSDSSSTGDSSSSSSTDSSSGGLLSGPASGYSSLIPQALTSSIMSDGGVGLADEFAQAIDPRLVK